MTEVREYLTSIAGVDTPARASTYAIGGGGQRPDRGYRKVSHQPAGSPTVHRLDRPAQRNRQDPGGHRRHQFLGSGLSRVLRATELDLCEAGPRGGPPSRAPRAASGRSDIDALAAASTIRGGQEGPANPAQRQERHGAARHCRPVDVYLAATDLGSGPFMRSPDPDWSTTPPASLRSYGEPPEEILEKYAREVPPA
ncbi:hypothetical protein E9229_003303 [Paeniglutamicibacter cryotolerans]|uniref:Uncharacterized protein n=1 Tax=Paeniglutamicibacter cryotolerans TaxID=670079 RepID=A0A839QSW5_9MICC|nr:hypothetical protein [Paeniglutamicibacter cryotolerans]